MRFWVGFLTAMIGMAAIVAVPMDLIHHNKCCHANDAIPGVTCCGQPKFDPNQASLVRHRPCCDPLLIQAGPSTALTASPVADAAVRFAGSAIASAPVQAGLPPRAVVDALRLHCVDPPCNDLPRYLVLGCFLI